MTSDFKSSDECMTASLIYKLCSHTTKQEGETLNSSYRFVLHALSSASFSCDCDEFVIVEKIKKKLIKHGGQKEALLFSDLYRKLQNSTVLKNTGSILTLLLNLKDTDRQNEKYTQFANELARIAASVPEISLHSKDIIRTKPNHMYNHVAQVLRVEKMLDVEKSSFEAEQSKSEEKTQVSDATALILKRAELEKTLSSWSFIKTGKKVPPDITKIIENNQNYNSLFQKDLLCDLIYIVQGISGKDIVGKQEHKNFTIFVKDSVSNMDQKVIMRYAEMGWMFTKINCYCEENSSEKSLGLIGQSFISGLQMELLEYYRVLAVLQAQLQNPAKMDDSGVNLPMTLHRLSIWFMEPFLRLQILASVVDASIGKKGGALISVLFSHLQHGNKSVRDPIKRLLVATIQPLYKMLNNWIFCGELDDAYGEFFVIANVTSPESNMWQEKYSLNKAMIPSFLTMEQAKKILSTGKAINFLCEVCQDHSFVKNNESLKKKHDAKEIESMFLQENESEFHLILEQNYQKTSSLVLNVLHKEYKLMSHFQAMRNYFLLGQGDFIRHIMDLLEPDLCKPANILHEHVLSGILDSAIRATNAQFHEQEILQRLCVHLLEFSAGDIGWDVFTLKYVVDGPIATVFTANIMMSYLRLFKSLWRAKQMEYILSSISQSRTITLKAQKHIPAVAPIAFQCHIILAQMVHFVQQMQYYNAFEVMECCWADLLDKIERAQDLDEVISAHEMFLDTLLKRSLLKEESTELQTQLKAIYNLIVKFQETQEHFWLQARDLCNMEDEQEVSIESKTKKGKWGIREKESKVYNNKMEKFVKDIIPSVKAQLRLLAHAYEDMVQKFLLMLNDHEDQNLRFLSFRLDFNEHFKNRNTRLHSSLTYLHRRLSLK